MVRTHVTVDAAVGTPPPALLPFVRRYIGYRFAGFPPGVHRGLPSRHLTMVLSLDEPTRVAASPVQGARTRGHAALVGGLDTRPAFIPHEGSQYGVQLELTPAGARGLLGVRAGDLRGTSVDLDALLGPWAGEMVERMAAAASWADRFAVLDEVLGRRMDRLSPVDPWLAHAWRLLAASGGALRVGEVAHQVGSSRRHLSARFAREYGLTPKEAARVVRFERSRALLTRPGSGSLADVAAACAYYDQAHLAREWNDLAGVPPTVWLATEVFPSVQDGGAGERAPSPHD